MTLDISKIRADFPVLDQQVNGSPLIYFDNAATTQKPKSVIDALSHYYASDNANIHRGLHALAERATNAYELTRTKIKEFIDNSDTVISSVVAWVPVSQFSFMQVKGKFTCCEPKFQEGLLCN